MVESKREKFYRLAENRMNTVLKQIELLGNLSNRNAYDYTDEDINKMVKTLKNAIANLEHNFNNEKKGKKFTLRG